MRAARLAVVASVFTAVLLALCSSVMAQVTTSTLRGTVKGADDNQAMAEVEVTLVNEATGDTRTTTTNGDGVFVFTNLQVGGPYHVTANFSGFKPVEQKGLILSANRTRDVSMALHLQEEVINVESNALARNISNRTVVTAAEIDELPSVNRDPRDLVRRNPEVTVEGGSRALSIGGANNRYNSITIDGVREDDDFGLNASGYPTRRSPIALSAVQELAVESAPFDVRYGKFLGGNVNIVTKSGTNEFKGTVLGTYSSDALLGSHSGSRTINVDYRDFRYGATVGGPIIKDKLFFLGSVEGLTSTTPIDNGPMGSGASTEVAGVSANDVMRAIQIANDVYGFDAGVPSRSVSEHDLKLLGKIDWTISPEHRATVIYQRTGGNSVQVGNAATSTSLPLSSNWYDANDTLNTFTGRVFSDWSDKLSTEVEANAKLVSSRVPSLNGNNFMAASITTSPGTILRLGPDNSRHANELDNDVLHGKAEVNYVAGLNLLTGGVEYERTYIDNLFIQNVLGNATYASLDAFAAKMPTQIVYQNSVTLTPSDAAANWNYGVATGYLQDQLKLTPDLTVQGGVRLESYQTSSHPALNQKFVARYVGTPFAERGTGENNATLNGRNILMPRLGINWLPMSNLNLRGGVGLYSGGTPGVWMSNNYTNDGIRVFSVTSRDAAVINGFNGKDIPMALQTAVMNGNGNGNVDVLDPDFRIPSVWKVGGGFDYSLDIPETGDYGRGLEIRGNYTYTKVRDGVNWIDLRRNLAILPNNTPIGTTVDGRALYSPNINTSRGVDMMLTNDPRGFGEVASVVVQKGFPFGLFVSASYAYTNNQEVSPGTASVSTSNYGQIAVIDPNHPELATSNYTRKHRFTGAFEYSHSIAGYFTDDPLWRDLKTSFGMFIESRSGQPYSWTFSGVTETGPNAGKTDTTGATLSRIFGEDQSLASRNRELFYVPQDAAVCEETFTPGCQVILKGMKREEFNTFLDRSGLSKYRGRIAPRNAFVGPSYNRVDLRFAQDLPNPIAGQRARIVVDVENFGNMLNSGWGLFRQTPFPYYAPAVDLGFDRASGAYTYTNPRSPNPTTGPSNTDVLLSVWRVGVGVMYDF
jgi:carboxypeptidase family protein/TonB-dependent receptor-like protein